MAQLATPAPAVLYKFRGDIPRDVKCLLVDRDLYLPSPLELNDPFDCLPALSIPPADEQERIIEAAIADAPPTRAADIRERFRLIYTSPLHRARFVEEFYKEDLRTLGVLSLSVVVVNPLLWAHYAENGTGFAVGYRGNDDGENEAVPAVPVIYSESRPRMPVDGETDWYRILATKSEHWSYEQEWRYLRVPEDGGTGLMRVPDRSILEVVLGPRMAPADASTVVSAALALPDKPRILRLHLAPDRFAFTLEKIG